MGVFTRRRMVRVGVVEGTEKWVYVNKTVSWVYVALMQSRSPFIFRVYFVHRIPSDRSSFRISCCCSCDLVMALVRGTYAS